MFARVFGSCALSLAVLAQSQPVSASKSDDVVFDGDDSVFEDAEARQLVSHGGGNSTFHVPSSQCRTAVKIFLGTDGTEDGTGPAAGAAAYPDPHSDATGHLGCFWNPTPCNPQADDYKKFVFRSDNKCYQHGTTHRPSAADAAWTALGQKATLETGLCAAVNETAPVTVDQAAKCACSVAYVKQQCSLGSATNDADKYIAKIAENLIDGDSKCTHWTNSTNPYYGFATGASGAGTAACAKWQADAVVVPVGSTDGAATRFSNAFLLAALVATAIFSAAV